MTPCTTFRTVLLCTSTLLVAHAGAQGSGIGLQGSFHMSTLHSALVKSELLPGGSVGLYFPISYGHRFELQPEVLFSAQGSSRNIADGDQSTLRLYYIHVPLNVKYFVTPIMNVQCGLQLGYLANGQQHTAGDITPVTEQFKPLDVAINAGIGVGSIHGWDITLRYTTGMTAVLRDDDLIYPTNRVFSLSVGHRFHKFGVVRRRRH